MTDVKVSGEAVKTVNVACNIFRHEWLGGGCVMVWGGIFRTSKTSTGMDPLSDPTPVLWS